MPTKGPAHSVPCPHCMKKIDFSDTLDMIDENYVFICDHCTKKVEVLSLMPTTIIVLEKK